MYGITTANKSDDVDASKNSGYGIRHVFKKVFTRT
jgi:hypothetical protein